MTEYVYAIYRTYLFEDFVPMQSLHSICESKEAAKNLLKEEKEKYDQKEIEELKEALKSEEWIRESIEKEIAKEVRVFNIEMARRDKESPKWQELNEKKQKYLEKVATIEGKLEIARSFSAGFNPFEKIDGHRRWTINRIEVVGATESKLEKIRNKIFAIETCIDRLKGFASKELLDIMQSSIEKIKELASEKEDV